MADLRLFGVAYLGVLLSAGCGPSEMDELCAPEEAPLCIAERAPGECSDTAQPAVCEGGVWSCPAGTLEESECTCAGPPPELGCTCTAQGWSC